LISPGLRPFRKPFWQPFGRTFAAVLRFRGGDVGIIGVGRFALMVARVDRELHVAAGLGLKLRP
jgi:hypothetical protein